MKEKHSTERRERGSALLVSLMVMVGMSLLGLAFVAISETESAISTNERNYTQALTVAEAGAKVCAEWFQDPDWGISSGVMPANTSAIKRERYLGSPTVSVGVYKPGVGSKLFDKPFKGLENKFVGFEQNPDVFITRENAEAFLDAFNEKLFPNWGEDGEVTAIEVYAPPVIGADIREKVIGGVTERFFDGGTRYGLATIKVTATKYNISREVAEGLNAGDPYAERRVIAQRIVKYVISEWPFPGPNGPIQSNANIATGGNFGVHWGKMTSQGTMEMGRPLVSIPWMGAYDWAHWERGYDSSTEWAPNRTYLAGEIVHPSAAALAANPDLSKYSFVVTVPGDSGATEPAWPTTPVTVRPDTGDEVVSTLPSPVRYRTRWSTLYPLKPAGGNPPITAATEFNWLYELLAKNFQDPWFQARARGDIVNEPGSVPQPYQYRLPTQDEVQEPSNQCPTCAGYSNWFQLQDTSNRDQNKKEVIFPKIDYTFWKEIAITGSGTTAGVKYLKWVAGDTFTDGIATKSFAMWLNVRLGAPAGFYFFDTKNQQNPQGPGAAGLLTPEIKMNKADSGDFTMQGFIYLNAENFLTTGLDGVATNVNMPGEPFADVGFRRVATTNGGSPSQTKGEWYVVDALGNWENNYLADNGVPDCQDLNENGICDIFVAPRSIRLPQDGSVTNAWLPVPYYPGCTVGSNYDETGSPTAGSPNCSEPHEPFVNLVYPTQPRTGGGGTPPEPLRAGWENPATQTYRPKNYSGGTTPVDCASTAQKITNCTSNGFDRDGAIIPLSPILDGVMYNEGDFRDTTGNADYFGSLLVNGNVGKAGNAEVWFDEKLIKGDWPPKRFKFPRVYVSALQTDQ